MQPERDLCQLHRHRVLVHTVDAALEHHATDDVPVVKLVRIHGPATTADVGENGGPDRVDSLGQRRDVVAPCIRCLRLGLGDGSDHLVGHQIDKTHQKVTRPHGRVADLQVKQSVRRVECPDLQKPVMFRKAAAGQLVDLASEGLFAGLDKRLQRLGENQLHQVIRGVVAARTPARKDVRPHRDPATITDYLVFEEALVDRTELLNAQAAVVDVLLSLRETLERQGVDHPGHGGIGNADIGQDRRAGRIEKAPVVRGQSDRGITAIDRDEQVAQRAPVTRGGFREDVAPVHAVSDIDAHLPQAVIIVSELPDRQKVAVLGVKDEEKAIEQDQRSVPHLLQVSLRRGLEDGARKIREHLSEHLVRQVFRDAPFVEPALFERLLMNAAGIGAPQHEGVAAEDQQEDLQPVAAVLFVEREQPLIVTGEIEDCCKVDLEELLRNGSRAREVEPPFLAVGEDAPPQPAFGHIVDAAHVTQHLGRRCGFLATPLRATVEWPSPSFGLDHRPPGLVALPFLRIPVGPVLGLVALEQYSVRNILAPPRGQVLLPKPVRPAERFQDWPDQVVLGLALVRSLRDREPAENLLDGLPEPIGIVLGERLPVVKVPNAVRQDIGREQTSSDCNRVAQLACPPLPHGQPASIVPAHGWSVPYLGARSGRDFGMRRRPSWTLPGRLLLDYRELLGGGFAVATGSHLEPHFLPLAQRPESGPFDSGDVDESVLRAVLRLDEPVALGGVEPLDRSSRHRRVLQFG